MANDNREVWITGIGFVSCLGEGAQTHWDILSSDQAKPVVDTQSFPPYTVHPMPEIDWSKQIAKRGDVRQMENWQRLGTYTAGLALEDAGMKDNDELVSTMDLVVAAGGGERDLDVDNQLMAASATRNDREMLINEKLPSELRPTLFLAQLSNLLAGNISIVHKVTGSSRTYMGEENAGVSAIENAASRIRAGSSTHALVGGSFNAHRLDALLPHELGNTLSRGGYAPILARQSDNPGMIFGSGGVFLVLEEGEHAKARGAKCYAKLGSIASALGSREDDKAKPRLDEMMQRLGVEDGNHLAILSGCSGAREATALETQLLGNKLPSAPVRYFQSMLGQMLEANFPAGIALAALALHQGHFYPAFEADEKAAQDAPSSILVTCISHHLGEGMAVIEKA